MSAAIPIAALLTMWAIAWLFDSIDQRRRRREQLRGELEAEAERLFPDGPDGRWPDACTQPPCRVTFNNDADRAEWRHCDNHAPRGRHHAPPRIYATVTDLASRRRASFNGHGGAS